MKFKFSYMFVCIMLLLTACSTQKEIVEQEEIIQEEMYEQEEIIQEVVITANDLVTNAADQLVNLTSEYNRHRMKEDGLVDSIKSTFKKTLMPLYIEAYEKVYDEVYQHSYDNRFDMYQENKYSISVSIDGETDIHNCNRMGFANIINPNLKTERRKFSFDADTTKTSKIRKDQFAQKGADNLWEYSDKAVDAIILIQKGIAGDSLITNPCEKISQISDADIKLKDERTAQRKTTLEKKKPVTYQKVINPKVKEEYWKELTLALDTKNYCTQITLISEMLEKNYFDANVKDAYEDILLPKAKENCQNE